MTLAILAGSVVSLLDFALCFLAEAGDVDHLTPRLPPKRKPRFAVALSPELCLELEEKRPLYSRSLFAFWQMLVGRGLAQFVVRVGASGVFAVFSVSIPSISASE